MRLLWGHGASILFCAIEPEYGLFCVLFAKASYFVLNYCIFLQAAGSDPGLPYESDHMGGKIKSTQEEHNQQ